MSQHPLHNSPSSSSSSSSSSSTKKSDRPSSLTPQRKHRKLLKDGSGTEVWPESLEKTFVEGLRQYWESPWATYSRGRSRWRNQFLVDYLQKAGITRSKKQVASHIQVLRNMWKGEPNYQLVAGGEEFFQENGLLAPVKIEDRDSSSLIPFDFDDTESLSPNFSPSDLPSEFPPSPGRAHSPLFPAESYSPTTHMSFPNTSLTDSPYSPVEGLALLPSPSSSGYPSLPSSRAVLQPVRTFEYPCTPPPKYSSSAAAAPSVSYSCTRNVPNRITMLRLYADGMNPLVIKVDSIVPVQPSGRAPAAMLKIRLGISSVDDRYCPPTLHGFSGNVYLAAVWGSYAKCITRVYAGGVCVSEESGALQISSIDVGTVIVPLPESPLTRCRWLDASVQYGLTQQIIVDNETLTYLVYELDRRPSPPSAQMLGYQAYRATDEVSVSAPGYSSMTQYAQRSDGASPTSLSYALGPSPNVRAVSTTVMTI